MEYRLGRLEQAVDKLAEVVTEFRVELATKAEVEALRSEMDGRVRRLEENQAAQRPWAAPAAAGSGLLAVMATVVTAWQASHGS